MSFVAAGTTNKIVLVFVQDVTKTAGEGLTGLTNATCGTLYYKRSNGSASVQVGTINTISTLGTFAGSSTAAAFKEVDATNMPGVYELHLPDNAFAAGASEVRFVLKGATNAAPLPLSFVINAGVVLASAGLDAVSVSETLAGSTLGVLTFRDRLFLVSQWLLAKRADDDGSVSGSKGVTIYNNAGNAAKWAATYSKTSGVTTIALPTITP